MRVTRELEEGGGERAAGRFDPRRASPTEHGAVIQPVASNTAP
jgi:hypothetical protein